VKNLCVVFTHNNARVIQTEDISRVHEYENVVINADLSYVAGVPPHFWKFENGFIVPMNHDEKKARLENIIKKGVDNDLDGKRLAELEEKRQKEELIELEQRRKIQAEIESEIRQSKEEYDLFRSSTHSSIAALVNKSKQLKIWLWCLSSSFVISMIAEYFLFKRIWK
jgi:hypothetical protein